ncbi:sugar kinase [Tianweitania sp.]|uniref:sugar kinase n=1 Tax=Tianweitania sp. TaxID=2021634 RepID=UPI00289A5F01|nr:sugar kinase [Tianweitania sp.]
MQQTLLSVGEAMIEMSAGTSGQWRMGFAGDTLNTAAHARAHLGSDWRVSYFTALGRDRYSAALRAFIEERGIETDRIMTIDDRRPGLYFIHQEDGDRHFTYWRDRSAARLLASDATALQTAFADVAMIYVSGITLAILDAAGREALFAALETARKSGARICFDPNIRPVLWSGEEEIRQTLQHFASVCDIVLPTYGDEAGIFNDKDIAATRDRYLGWGAREIVVKNGSEAALASADGQEVSVDPKPVSTVVDATGAGDSFNGAYVAARIQGASLQEAVEKAHQVAAICIGHHGALPSRQTADL